jgi:hypothetical protein
MDADRTKATALEGWFERHSPGYRYGWVLLFLTATFIVMAGGPPDPWTRVVTVFFQGLTLLAALLASRAGRRLLRIASVVVLLALIAAIATVVVSGSKEPSGVFFALDVLLAATAPVVIGRALWRRQVVDIHTVLGAVCIYVLLGMMFAFLYAAVDRLGADPFFVQTSHPTVPIYLYFSYITQTTVGYGDYTAAGDLGHAMAVIQAMLGQLYLVTVIAVLVSRIGGMRASPPEPVRTPADADT